MSPRKLTQLGRAVALPASPDKARLEAVPNPHPGDDYLVRFTAPEISETVYSGRLETGEGRGSSMASTYARAAAHGTGQE